MATATPLLLCDMVYQDPASGNVTLLGIFTDIRATRFPSPARQISAYALLAGDPGEFGEVRLLCVEEENEQLHLDERRRTDIGLRGKRHIHIPLGMDFGFPRPGRYRFSLFFNDNLIGEQTIPLTLREAS